MANSSGMVVRGSMRISRQAGSLGSKKVKAGERRRKDTMSLVAEGGVDETGGKKETTGDDSHLIYV